MKRVFLLVATMVLGMSLVAQNQNSVRDTEPDYSPALAKLNAEGVQLGVALCGGSAFGYAHLGFLQALEDAGVRVDKERMVRKTRIFKPNLHHDGGMADYTHLRKMMAKYIPYNSFDSLKIPFYCCVSDMNHLKPVYVSTGDKLREYVSASASVPRVFAPVMIDSVYYVDGYIFNNLPVEPLIDAGCNVTIGLYIQRDTVMERIDDPSIISSRAFAVNSNLCTLDHVHLCTYGIAIKVGDLGKLDFGKIDEFFEYGYKAGKEFLEELCGVEAKKDTKD